MNDQAAFTMILILKQDLTFDDLFILREVKIWEITSLYIFNKTYIFCYSNLTNYTVK